MPQQLLPEEVIALNAELATGYHKELEEKLSNPHIDPHDVPTRIGIVAEYCGVVLDGMYSPENDLPRICGNLVPRLIAMRTNPTKDIYVQ